MPNFRVAVIEQMPILCPVHAVGTRLRIIPRFRLGPSRHRCTVVRHAHDVADVAPIRARLGRLTERP